MSPHNTVAGATALLSVFLFVVVFFNTQPEIKSKVLGAQALMTVIERLEARVQQLQAQKQAEEEMLRIQELQRNAPTSTGGGSASGDVTAQNQNLPTSIQPPVASSTGVVSTPASQNTTVSPVTTRVVQNDSVPQCTFTRGLDRGTRGEDVECLQEFLSAEGFYTFPEGPTGYFGDVTWDAVGAWQRAQGISLAPTDYGYFGPISRSSYRERSGGRVVAVTPSSVSNAVNVVSSDSPSVIASTGSTNSTVGGVGTGVIDCVPQTDLTIGDRGDDVTCLQRTLQAEGYYTYEDGATGFYGEVTREAVRAWQRDNELLETGEVTLPSRVKIAVQVTEKLVEAISSRNRGSSSGGGSGSSGSGSATVVATNATAGTNQTAVGSSNTSSSGGSSRRSGGGGGGSSSSNASSNSNSNQGENDNSASQIASIDDTTSGVANKAPIARAGSDQSITLLQGQTETFVSIQGGASTDEDGTIVSYTWKKEGAEIATGMAPAPLALPAGSHTLTLTVTDDAGATHSDTVTIAIHEADNQSPNANAGEDVVVIDINKNGRERVQLSGSGEDSDGQIVSYAWTENGEELSKSRNPNLDFSLGEHEVTLTVTDNDGATGSDTLSISVVEPVNQVPTAIAGPDQEVTDQNRSGTEMVNLDGSDSEDVDGDIESYVWTENGVEIATGERPRNVEFAVGMHTVLLTVTDDSGVTDEDTLVIRVIDRNNEAPTANAGSAQTLTDTNGDGVESVQLSGSGEDTDGTIESYTWSEGGDELSDEQNPVVELPMGAHTLTLTVTDNDGAVATDEVVITIEAPEVDDSAVVAGDIQTLASVSVEVDISQLYPRAITQRLMTASAANAGAYISGGIGTFTPRGTYAQSMPGGGFASIGYIESQMQMTSGFPYWPPRIRVMTPQHTPDTRYFGGDGEVYLTDEFSPLAPFWQENLTYAMVEDEVDLENDRFYVLGRSYSFTPAPVTTQNQSISNIDLGNCVEVTPGRESALIHSGEVNTSILLDHNENAICSPDVTIHKVVGSAIGNVGANRDTFFAAGYANFLDNRIYARLTDGSSARVLSTDFCPNAFVDGTFNRLNCRELEDLEEFSASERKFYFVGQGFVYRVELVGGVRTVSTGEPRVIDITEEKPTVISVKPNGEIDRDFGVNGVASFSVGSGVGDSRTTDLNIKTFDNGQIGVWGRYLWEADKYFVVLLNPDGSLVSDFGDEGVAFIPGTDQSISKIERLHDDSILVFTQASDRITVPRTIIKLNPDGSVAEGFGTNGVLTINAWSSEYGGAHSGSMLLIGDKIHIAVISGPTNKYLRKKIFTLNGQPDTSFNGGDWLTVPIAGSVRDYSYRVVLAPDASVYVSESRDFQRYDHISHYSPNLIRDEAFGQITLNQSEAGRWPLTINSEGQLFFFSGNIQNTYTVEWRNSGVRVDGSQTQAPEQTIRTGIVQKGTTTSATTALLANVYQTTEVINTILRNFMTRLSDSI